VFTRLLTGRAATPRDERVQDLVTAPGEDFNFRVDGISRLAIQPWNSARSVACSVCRTASEVAQAGRLAEHTTGDSRLRRERRRTDWGLILGLPRALWTLANDALVAKDRPCPAAGLELSPPGPSHVVHAGRATHVPQAAVTSGIQRIVTVTRRGRSG
jgi:hypothetical protein